MYMYVRPLCPTRTLLSISVTLPSALKWLVWASLGGCTCDNRVLDDLAKKLLEVQEALLKWTVQLTMTHNYFVGGSGLTPGVLVLMVFLTLQASNIYVNLLSVQ
ncbi:hypothetical protein EV363DRAFT_672594 [Boletus edulis]|uniref:Uncharacterized protein n=1 Tax=Boletus edulis BED1 TaxID=1328754 RepID=A0AAD4G4J2_BOLED|nr:hypothetical protein EV363DRAFT_672594 [Boletus edulis]KAF8414837.1 hypothetical protein L210DRAFT_2852797 [Boletus edulis BED1]